MVNNHFTATGIVFNSENKILMIKHRKLGVWLPPGGHVEKNELPCDALMREIFEETGISAKIIPYGENLNLNENGCRQLANPFVILLEDIEGDGSHNHIDLVYLCRATNSQTHIQEKEVDDIGWFSLEEIKNLKTFENVLKTAEKAISFMSR